MARIFVTNDNQSAWAEIMDADAITGEEGALTAFCVGCNREDSLGIDLLEGERARFSLDDAIEEVVSPHVYSCQMCADDACLIPTRHRRGHNCRKMA